MVAATTTEGHYVKWTSPVPSSLPDPVITEAAHAKNLDKLLDDDFGDGDEDMEDRGDDLDDLHDLGGDDWIVDDDGAYGVEDGEKTRGGRTEVGKWRGLRAL
jgi:chromosome transmission fidelity protein 4